MKEGIIELFLDAFGWVFGRAFLLAAAVITGLVIGLTALLLGTLAAGGGFSLGGSFQADLLAVVLILPQVGALFWTGMWYLRSEKAGIRTWGGIVAAQALLTTSCFFIGLPKGWLAPSVAVVVFLTLVGMMGTGLWFLEQWQMNRHARHLIELEAINARKRAELKARFGTESAGIRETGLE